MQSQAEASTEDVGTTLREAYSLQHEITTDSFETQVFRRCLYRRSALLATSIRRLHPEFFQDERSFVSEIGNVRTFDELLIAVKHYRQAHRARGLLRGFLRVRLSTERILKLGREVLSDNPS